jgi:hypothetical protein
MASKKQAAPLRVKLNTTHLSDQDRVDLAATMGAAAPSSAFYAQHPAVHSSIDAVIAAGLALAASIAVVRDLEKKLEIAKETNGLNRSQFAKASTALNPPTGVAIHLGRKHGQFRASAVYTGRAKYAAQVSTDPIGPATWQDLSGNGKERTVTGHPSGSLVWIRFRTIAKIAQSDWCTPVAVTVP